MRPLTIAFASLVALLLLHGVARADWYYDWWCTGDCAPGELGISGTEGPFASREDCDAVRGQDRRADYFVAEGNFGGLEFCEERNAAPAPTSSYAGSEGAPGTGRPATMARMHLSALAGSGYRVEDPMGMVTSNGYTAGFELGVQTGSRPELGGEMLIGLQYARVTDPSYGVDAKPMTYIPWLVGLVSNPAVKRGKTEVRLDLGGDIGALIRVGCSDCAAVGLPTLIFAAELHAGLDVYFGEGGLGLDAVFLYGPQEASDGSAILPPALLIRASLITRFRDHVGW